MPVSHLYDFFEEMPVHVFCPFFDVIICFVCVEFEKFFIDPGYQPLVCTVICKYRLPFCGLPLCFVDCFLCCELGTILNADFVGRETEVQSAIKLPGTVLKTLYQWLSTISDFVSLFPPGNM